ncbi:type II secretion system F family protein [Lihuaxuella thermophila]|uniref:Tight adherence protein C n=1 Tax=Lihuaxuella thermophila TaxID=1173111 RepID=A0A1H8I3Y5_9BACL|nr:type II secretion system F family protein [Lihuaxuella thermophila]SEN63169.1 tight adherence protein C [Lihuaxuella thermophila]
MIIFMVLFLAWISLIIAAFSYIKFREQKQQIDRYLDEKFDKVVLKAKDDDKLINRAIKWFDQLAPVGNKIQLLSDPVELEEHLLKAGYPYGLTVDRIQGAKIVFALIGLGFGFFGVILGLPLASFALVFYPLIGYCIPILGIRLLAKRRQEQIRYDLPDFLDMMSITLQAGMSLDSALMYFVNTSKGPLSEELAKMNQEIRFGVQREVAYRALLSRTESPELDSLIQSMIQAHNLGTPISETFAQQAEEMRKMRGERAKEAAGKAEPKISIVGGLIIAPSIVLLIIGSFVLKYFFSDDSPFKGMF